MFCACCSSMLKEPNIKSPTCITPLEKLKCAACVCAEQARRYIAESMGQQYAEGLVLDLDAMLTESDNRTPMVCLLSMGSDPTENIERLAKSKVSDWKERMQQVDK